MNFFTYNIKLILIYLTRYLRDLYLQTSLKGSEIT